MKKDVLWITICVFALIVGLCIGYIIGNNSAKSVGGDANSTVHSFNNNAETNSAIGSYKNDNWNGKSAALVLKADGTCLYPTGFSGKWVQDGTVITITLDGVEGIHLAEQVVGGIILHAHFFESVE